MRLISWIWCFISVGVLQSCRSITAEELEPTVFNWQGHRGARGLLPENTIPSFLKALEFPVAALELDIVVSSDQQLIVSHDPWMERKICQTPEGEKIGKAEAMSFNLFEMTAKEIQAFDCGSLGHPDFKNQEKMAAVKPTLEEVVLAVRQYCQDNERDFPIINIEVKSRGSWYGEFVPRPAEYAALVLADIERLQLRDHCMVQSFDARFLEAFNDLNSGLPIGYLVAELKSLNGFLEELTFQPDYLNPYYFLVSKPMVKKAHKKGIKVIPWTVNSKWWMKYLIRMGVDGIITDYPDLIEEVSG